MELEGIAVRTDDGTEQTGDVIVAAEMADSVHSSLLHCETGAHTLYCAASSMKQTSQLRVLTHDAIFTAYIGINQLILGRFIPGPDGKTDTVSCTSILNIAAIEW